MWGDSILSKLHTQTRVILLLAFDSKLQSDMKTTKVEELRIQMESFYNEVLRLQQSKSADAPTFR